MNAGNAELQRAMGKLAHEERRLDNVQATFGRDSETFALALDAYRTAVKLALLAYYDAPASRPYVVPTPLPPAQVKP